MILAQWRARRASKTLIEQIRGEIVAAALARNVYGAKGPEAVPKAEALARHIASLDAALATIPIEVFTAGRFRFPLGLIAAGVPHD